MRFLLALLLCGFSGVSHAGTGDPLSTEERAALGKVALGIPGDFQRLPEARRESLGKRYIGAALEGKTIDSFDEGQVFEIAGRVLRWMPAAANARAIAEMRKALDDKNTERGDRAFKLFVGSDAKSALPEVMKRFGAADKEEQRFKLHDLFTRAVDALDSDDLAKLFRERASIPKDLHVTVAAAVARNREAPKRLLPELIAALRAGGSKEWREHVGYALGASGHEDAIGPLFDVIRNEKEVYETRIRAVTALRDTRKHWEKLLPPILAFTQSKQPHEDISTSLLYLMEAARSEIPEKAQAKFDEQLDAAFKLGAGRVDPCKLACTVAQQSKNWDKETFFDNPEFWSEGYPKHSWRFAIRTLGSLFRAKASRFCPDVKAAVIAESKDLSALLAKANRENRVSGAHPGDASVVYGQQFYLLLLREWLRTDAFKTKESRANAETEASAIEKQLARDVSRFTWATTGVGGSLFNTFTLASASTALATPPGDVVKAFEKMITDAKSPLEIPYDPKDTKLTPGRATARGAVARAIPFHWLLYRSAADDNTRQRKADDLVLAIENYSRHLPSLLAHVRRNATHADEQGLAPYFFYPSIGFATASTQWLLENQKLDRKQRHILESARDRMTAALAYSVTEEGLARPHGGSTYPSSPAYVNPLLGLALLPLIDRCAGTALPRNYGIIDALTRAEAPAVPRHETQNGSSHSTSM